MEICLYDPQLGYYAGNAEQFGKSGDFYTSSDLHAVFGRLIARQAEEIWRALDRPPRIEILELGPGRGLFARDVLHWSKKKFPDFFSALTYSLEESSPSLRKKLEDNLRDEIANGKAQIRISEEHGARVKSKVNGKVKGIVKVKVGTDGDGKVPEVRPPLAQPAGAETSRAQNKSPAERPTVPFRHSDSKTPRVVFANEFFDALPVEILSVRGKLHLALQQNRLCEIWLKPQPDELEFLDRYGVHPEQNERIEVPLIAQNLANDLGAEVGRGVIIAVDYGYTRKQQLAGRYRGTLMTYRNHSASPDPYQAPGEQDITAHVNFTALAAACEMSGMLCESLLTQSQFLMGIGQCNEFADIFEECRLPQEKAKRALQLKHLISPEGMGETFQVLIASRNLEATKLRSLSGLTYARSGRWG